MCPASSDHVWKQRPSKKMKCPFCSGRKLSKTNSLKAKFPEIAKEWHPYKNGHLTPQDVTYKSQRKIWWKCEKAEDHEWAAKISNRVILGRGCSCCAGRTVVKSNCLSTSHPALAKEWHSIKNYPVTPLDVVSGSSNRKYWWKCSKEHEWLATPNNRSSNGRGCPICKESKGEKSIADVLSKNNILYKRQHRFDGCKLQINLPFDFVFEYKGKIAAIEYQGKQHYVPYAFGSKKSNTKNNLCLIKKRDKIKLEWCKNNNINFLIIPYWKFNEIEKEINIFLNIF